MDSTTLMACVTMGLACFLLTWPGHRWLSCVIGRFERWLGNVLAEMFMIGVTPRKVTFIMTAFLAGITIVLYLLFENLLSLLAGVAIGVLLPLFVIHQMVKRRRTKLENQLLDGLITLANGMRAGLNLGQAMGLIENHSEAPLSQEFGLINREVEHGISVDVALDNAGRRLRSHNFRLLFATMKTTRVRGGNMPETLDRLGESLREIVRLEEKVKSQTAQGKTSAVFMGLMPLVVLGIYYMIDRPGVSLLFTQSIGHVVLLGCVVLDIWGFLWIRKIVSFEI